MDTDLVRVEAHSFTDKEATACSSLTSGVFLNLFRGWVDGPKRGTLRFLETFPNVRELVLHYGSSEGQGKFLARLVRGLHQLEGLKTQQNTMTVPDWNKIAIAIGESSSLRFVRLGNFVSGYMARHVLGEAAVIAMYLSNSIRSLRSQFSLGQEGVEPLVSNLCRHDCSLEELGIAFHYWTPRQYELFCAGLRANTSLRKLQVRITSIPLRRRILEALSNHPSIVDLHLVGLGRDAPHLAGGGVQLPLGLTTFTATTMGWTHESAQQLAARLGMKEVVPYPTGYGPGDSWGHFDTRVAESVGCPAAEWLDPTAAALEKSTASAGAGPTGEEGLQRHHRIVLSRAATLLLLLHSNRRLKADSVLQFAVGALDHQWSWYCPRQVASVAEATCQLVNAPGLDDGCVWKPAELPEVRPKWRERAAALARATPWAASVGGGPWKAPADRSVASGRSMELLRDCSELRAVLSSGILFSLRRRLVSILESPPPLPPGMDLAPPEEHEKARERRLESEKVGLRIRRSLAVQDLERAVQRLGRASAARHAMPVVRWRRAVDARRDASLIFGAASNGRPLELQKRLVLGVKAGGLSMQGVICLEGKPATVGPLEAARAGGHLECVQILEDAIASAARESGS